MKLTPVMAHPAEIRDRIREKAVAGLKAAFPMELRGQKLELEDVAVHTRDFGPEAQKQALLDGSSLHEPVKATVLLKDSFGKVIEKVKNFTLLHLPYFTERHSFIVGGNEYQVANQVRMKPGVYTRRRANDELEAAFNLAKGSNFRLSLDPIKGHPYMEYGTTQIPLYPVLRKLGVPHEDIAKHWGADVATANGAVFGTTKKQDAALEKLYGKLVHPSKQTHTTPEAKLEAVHAAYRATVMDPTVNEVTLKHPHEKVSPLTLLHASQKLLDIYKNGTDTDDRDSLAFKQFMSVDDFVKERISLDARTMNMKVKTRASNKTSLREILPSAPFTAGVRTFLTGSQLSAIPTQINPVELLDHAAKVTSLGEGGISSERAVPMEARQLHPTHFAIMDQVRTPEAFTAGIDIRTSILTQRDEKGNLYTTLRHIPTGEIHHIPAHVVAKSVVAFPNQKMTGLVDVLKDGKVQAVPHKEVEYEVIHPSHFYSLTTNLIPMMESIQGNRATMGSKMQTQALPLVHREVPWVQVGTRVLGDKDNKLTSFEKEINKLVCATAPVSGTVAKIDKEYIYLRPSEKKHAADTLSAPRYSKATQRKQEHVASPEMLEQIGRVPLSELGGFTVCRVNGQAVREKLDLDFVAGGNPARYGYVPDNEIWVEGTQTEFGATALHEFVETKYMYEGMSYDKAHEQALRIEQIFRAAHPNATIDEARQWLGALEQSVQPPEQKVAAVKRQKTVGGVTMKIELEPGDVRSGVSPEGKKWSKTMSVAYGYIPKSEGDDGECVDIYLNETEPAFLQVYAVKQRKKDGTHDEDKVMVGFKDKAAAIEAYKKHGPAWGLGDVESYSWEDFKEEYLEPRRKEAADKSDAGLVKVPYETNFPFASKTYLTQDLKVKVGDKVDADQTLTSSNYSKDDHLALGKNLKVGYFTYYGLNSNDAIVISEGAAKKLTSEHCYREILDVDPDVTLGREVHRANFGAKYTGAQYDKLDADGVIKKGAKVMPHDLLIAGVRKGKLSSTDILLGNLKKSLARPYREESREWHHDNEGEVIEVYKSPKRIAVVVRTHEPMKIGDKLSNRIGAKGVISRIVPDHQMVQDEKGTPIDVLLTPAGVISRINSAQIVETAIAKVAEKTGKPLVLENFSGRDNVQWAKELLKKHGVKDKETVFDPVSGKSISGILVGPQYFYKLFKTTDSNFAARGIGGYDVNRQPTKGGDTGAKGIGKMELNALIAHNARNVLKETATIKSEQSDEFWRAAQLGLPLPPMKKSFVYDKMLAMMQGAGIRVDQRGDQLLLKPMTDNDVKKLSAGAIQNDKLVRAKDLAPERGGFFDPALTGGASGTNWSHIELAEHVVNPIFAEPARRLLGMTTKEFEDFHFSKGGAEVKKKLNNIDLDAHEKALRSQIKTLKGSALDDAIKQVKYCQALRKIDQKAGDAYVISKLAVLPPVMRPIVAGQGGGNMVVGDSNYLYQNAFLHNAALKRQVDNPILPPAEHEQLRRNMYQAVGAVIGTHETDNQKLEKRNVKGFLVHLTGKTTPKSSFVQKKVIKRQQDLSGRGTIVPDGSLSMDQIGIPEEMLWEMFSKFIVARLIRRGFGAVRAKEMLDEKHPAARDCLLAEVNERPVMLNRAPTLHRFNFHAAYAVPMAGKTIRINSFADPLLGGDYDGDTVQIHTPVLPAAVEETKRMVLSELIFGDKQKDDLWHVPRMEATLGLHLATAASSGKKHKFKTKADAVAAYHRGEIQLNDEVEITQPTKHAAEQPSPEPEDLQQRILKRLSEQHPVGWKEQSVAPSPKLPVKH